MPLVKVEHPRVIREEWVNNGPALTAPCPVCRKRVPLARYKGNVWRLTYHLDRFGLCNGTSLKCYIVLRPSKEELS